MSDGAGNSLGGSEIPIDQERSSSRIARPDHELPPHVVDRLMVIYFTHVHVSPESSNASVRLEAHDGEPLAHRLQAPLLPCLHSRTSSARHAVRRSLRGPERRNGPVR